MIVFHNFPYDFLTLSVMSSVPRQLVSESSTTDGTLLDWEKYALSWDGGESGDFSESPVPSTGEDERESFPDPFQEKLPFCLWNCCRADKPDGVGDDSGLSVVIECGCEVVLFSSLVFPDQLKTPWPGLEGWEGDTEGLDDSSLIWSSLAWCSSVSGSSHKDCLSPYCERQIFDNSIGWGASCFEEASCVSVTFDSPWQKNLMEMLIRLVGMV